MLPAKLLDQGLQGLTQITLSVEAHGRLLSLAAPDLQAVRDKISPTRLTIAITARFHLISFLLRQRR